MDCDVCSRKLTSENDLLQCIQLHQVRCKSSSSRTLLSQIILQKQLSALTSRLGTTISYSGHEKLQEPRLPSYAARTVDSPKTSHFHHEADTPKKHMSEMRCSLCKKQVGRKQDLVRHAIIKRRLFHGSLAHLIS